MPSFDVVSQIDGHELTNAVDQANRELATRFDFRGTGAEYTRDPKDEFVITMRAKLEHQLKQMLDILMPRLAKRGIDLSCVELKDPDVNLNDARQRVVLKHGIDSEAGRKVTRLIKESKLKVQAQVQGDKVRVTAKQRDDLQAVMSLLRQGELGIPLQFENFRD